MNKNKWSRRILYLLRWPAVATGAAVTGISAGSAAAPDDPTWAGKLGNDPQPLVLPNTLNSTAENLYAAHRSHSSHRSHRSSSGGGYTPSPSPSPSYPPPSYVSPTPRQMQPLAPPAAPRAVPGDVSSMVIRVQAALMRLGFFKGDIDGVLGPETRSSIIAYQKSQGLKQTGRMDIKTLTKLGISIP